MEQTIIALLLLVNNEIKEARIQKSISECLARKRVSMRQVNNNVSYQCITSMAELEKNIDGSYSIKKLIMK
jgi:hypothetical protein